MSDELLATASSAVTASDRPAPAARSVGSSFKTVDGRLELERMPTGIIGLDHLLEGGLVRGNSLLIEGSPGSGKSSLAVRIVHEGIVKYGEPGLIITFEEFPRQLYEESMLFGVDLKAHERAGMLRVVWTPPARIIQGFSGQDDLVDKIVKQLGVRRLLIDSITHFKRAAVSEIDLREVLAGILSKLKMQGINAMLVKELSRLDDESIAFEEYLVDASLRLYNSRAAGAGENLRAIEVRKTRGQGHISGRHPFELVGGLKVFPRLRPSDVARVLPRGDRVERRRVPTGVDGLDEMLCGGLWNRTMNIVAGPPGTGKSVLAYHFLNAGLACGEPGLLLSIKDTSERILDEARSLGMDWTSAFEDGQLTILHYPATGLCVEKMLNAMISRLRRRRPRRLVFDSIDDLWGAVKDQDQIRDYVLVLANVFDVADTTSLIMNEHRHMGGAGDVDVPDYGYLASCEIKLELRNRDETVARFVSVTKHAGSDHSKRLREYRIDGDGMQLHDGTPRPLTAAATTNDGGGVDDLDRLAELLRSLVDGCDEPAVARRRLRAALTSAPVRELLLAATGSTA